MSFQVGQPSVSGTVATVVVTFAWGKGTSTINVSLMQAGDRWQIAGIARGSVTTQSRT